MIWDEWIAENHRALEEDGTPFERLFVEEILRNVPNLSPVSVSAQTQFLDLAGNKRRIDFTIEEGEFVRIALEVDGYDKTGTGGGQSRHEFQAWSYRELSMTAAGWVPLRFANGLIKREPEDLRECIELQLKMRRRVKEAVKADGGKAEAARDKKRELESAAEAASKGGGAAEENLRKLLSQRRKSGAAYLSVADRERLYELQDHIDELNEELLKERGLRQLAEGENRGMKVLTIAFATVVVAIVALFLVLGSSDDQSPSVAPCDNATPAAELTDADVDSVMTAKGEVTEYKTFDGGVYLNLGADFPNQDLAVVITDEKFANWKTPPEDLYDSREVAVTGRLGSNSASLEIPANSPNDVAICP